MFRKLSFFAVLVLLAVSATIVFAAVTINPSTGVGFVGKGDVQDAFGWNNNALQDNSANVSFVYQDEVVLSQLCQREAGNSEIKTKTFTRTRGVNSVVLYEARKNSQGQVTGFDLTGFQGGATFDGGSIPSDICPDPNDNPAKEVWSPVDDVVVESSSGGGLYVNYGGQSVLLP